MRAAVDRRRRRRRGAAIVASRSTGLCLLCHAGRASTTVHGHSGADLAGVGARSTPAQLRLRIVDAAALQPGDDHASYGTTDGLERVAAAWRGQPILDAQQVEDVVAYLATLK